MAKKVSQNLKEYNKKIKMLQMQQQKREKIRYNENVRKVEL